MRTIITTVGTSLLQNAKRDLQAESPSTERLKAYLRQTDPVKASAETNSLSRMLAEGDKVVFLHSETEEGRNCAEALARFYEEEGFRSELVMIPHLTYAEKQFKMRGLRSLVGTIVELVEREKVAGNDVAINATGGFKAEIAYATLIGLLYDIPVYYIHDAFKEIVDLPPAPIEWDLSLLEAHHDFFRWIASDLRQTRDADHRLRGLPSEIRLLLTEEEGYTFLSPVGEVIYRAWEYRKVLDQPTRMLPREPSETLTVLQGHRTLWGHIKRISDIPDEEVRILLRRLLSFEFVTSVSLGVFTDYERDCRPTRLEQPRIAEDGLKVIYTLCCQRGREEVVVNVKKGFARQLIEMVGHEARV